MDVQFNEPEYSARPKAQERKPSFLTSLVIRAGLAKDERSARPVLLIVLAVLVVATLAMLVFTLIPAPMDAFPDPSA